MLPIFLRLILAVLTVTSAGWLRAAEPPKTYPLVYVKAMREAIRGFQERDWDRALGALDKVEKLAPPTVLTQNIRGAIACEQRRFEDAEKYLREALRLDPKYYPARFNLAEVQLMQKDYPGARKLFQQLVDEQPKDELARFRILLTYLLEKDDAAANATLALVPFPGDTPAYYYGNAAWEFSRGNPEEGKKWVGRGNWVFKPEAVKNYADSLFDLGWLQPEDVPKAKGDTTPRAPLTPYREPAVPFTPQKPAAPLPGLSPAATPQPFLPDGDPNPKQP